LICDLERTLICPEQPR